MLHIFNDFRFNGRNINYLMTQRFFVGFFKICAAAWTQVRLQVDTVGNFLRRQELSQMWLMSVFCSAFWAKEPLTGIILNVGAVPRRVVLSV